MAGWQVSVSRCKRCRCSPRRDRPFSSFPKYLRLFSSPSTEVYVHAFAAQENRGTGHTSSFNESREQRVASCRESVKKLSLAMSLLRLSPFTSLRRSLTFSLDSSRFTPSPAP
eukprot:3708966-Pleurochrysis_carterae.AAC.1